MLEIGKKLPALKGTTGDGNELKLAGFKGQWLVVYFYPKDSTPGCTNEAKDFRDLHPRQFRHEAGVAVPARVRPG